MVRFDGVDDALHSALARPQPYTMFAVAKVDGAVNQYLIDGQMGTVNLGVFSTPNGTTTMYVYAGALLTMTVASVTSFFVGSAVIDGSSSLGVFNGTTTSGDAGALSPDGTTLGSAGDGSSPLTGDIAEAIFYTGALSTLDRRSIEAYLGAKYGVAVV